MKSFRYNIQTAVYFGRNCVKENADFFGEYGKRAVIFTTPFPEGHPNLALQDVEEVLRKTGIEYLVLDGVEIDPPVETCAALAKEAGRFGADFFVAAGGGSSIDTAKAVAVLIDHPEEQDPYKVLYAPVSAHRNIKSQCRVPVIGIPTTAGTAAEISPFAVLTRADIHTKLAMTPWVYCLAAFVDSRYIEHAPPMILHTGIFDALAHGVESYVNTGGNRMNRSFGEFGFSLFRSFKDHLLSGKLTTEDFDSICLHSVVQGQAFSSTLGASTTLPHGMGYPLSHLKHVNHGLSCAIFLGEYVRGFRDQAIVRPLVEMCGFGTADEFADYCKSFIELHVDIAVSEQELQQWTDDMMKTNRLPTHPEPVDREDIYALYAKSLERYVR